MTNNIKFNAETRLQFGGSAAKKIKRQGMVPAIIYGKDGNNIHISIDRKSVEQEYFKGNLQSIIAEINLDNKIIKVIAHKIELDPVSDAPIHIDFFNAESSKIKAQVKVIFINKDKSIGLKRGGFLNIVKRKISVICDNGAKIPNIIEFDATNLRVGSKVRCSDIELPSGIALNLKSDSLIASITGRASKEDKENAGSENSPAKTDDKKASTAAKK